MPSIIRLAASFGALVLVSGALAGEQLSVVSTAPARHALGVPPATAVAVTFDRPVQPASVDALSFRVMGRWTGPMGGTFAFADGDQTVIFTPSRPFTAGDPVTITLSHDLAGADGAPMRPGGYSYWFRTRALPADMVFAEIETISVRTTPSNTRIYGGLACDLDLDGWLDLSIINEDSADIRVLMNEATGAGTYGDVLRPTTAIEAQSSPNEPADFNHDGFVDICTASGFGVLSVVLGNGDGTFQPRQAIDVGSGAHGVAVLDVDGDGDPDIVTANTSSNNLALTLNDGSGVFGPATFFEGGGNGEYALGAADMNNDGIMDLVVGAHFSQEIIIHLGNGDGTFTEHSSRDAGGAVWMLVCGDVNGDGNMDVTTANSFSSTGSILLGDGTGSLASALVSPAAAHVVATDVGDLDGDGDLDWVLSSFSGGQWWVYRNDGAGGFTFDQSFDAASNCACCVLLDVDNDHDLDLALLDEIADLVTIMENTGTPPGGPDLDGDGTVGPADLAILLAAWGACGDCEADLDGDGIVGPSDLAILLAAWGS